MHYYRIIKSLNLKEIGIYPQSITANYQDEEIGSASHLDSAGFHKLINSDAVIPEPILRKTAKKSDLISAVSIMARMVISDRLKGIMEKYNSEDIQYLTMNIIFKDQKVPYWLVNGYNYDMSFIDYSNSDVWLVGGGGINIQKEPISSYEEYIARKKSLVLPLGLEINKTVLSAGRISKESFVLLSVETAICHVVSERVKNEIENAGCTGINFEPVPVL